MPRPARSVSRVIAVGNLPAELSGFVGRRRDVAAVERLLSSARLVTLTGVGGVGKSRLALRVATRRRRSFRHGVWLVELAGVQAPELVAHTVAEALRVGDQSGRTPLAVLCDAVREKNLLLLLDNCEHLPGACAELAAALLAAAPGLTILATSRQSLGLTGEHLWPVAPLEVDGPAQNLFAQRASAVLPEFALTKENRADVARVCTRLDGIPLAIELAAVWVRTLSVPQLAERLDDRFGLLTGGPLPAPRHRSLHAAVRWSHELCTPGEQALWARLSVFAGSLDAMAAEAVCPGGDVLVPLRGLVDKSILLGERHADQPRYRLLETLREYGSAQLRDTGERTAVHRAHRDHYLAVARRLAADWFGPDQLARLARLRADHDNLRAALEFCLTEPGETRAGLRLATDLSFYWHCTGQLREGRHWLNRCLAADPCQCVERALALAEAGRIAAYQGDVTESATLLAESRALAERLGDPAGLARATQHLAITAGLRGEPSLDYLEEALARYDALSTPDGMRPLAQLQHAMATAFYGEPARGLALCEARRQASEARDELWLRSYAHHGLAHASWRLGLFAQAADHSVACLRIKSGFGDLMGIALALELLGWTTAEPDRAATLLGAAHHAWELFGMPLFGTPLFGDSHDACATRLGKALGQQAFDAAFTAGQELAPDRAVAYALREDHPPQPRPSPAEAEPSLTKRERQVAELIGAGLSNRQIASRLVISQRTAESHVEHILAKLGLANRTQVATWVTATRTPPAPR